MKHPHLFGPVNSRRLGISLGVDIITPKTCSLDCTYCECGVTTNLTSERKEYVSSKEIISELDDYLSKKPVLDYITFSGSGEPTLNSGLYKIVNHIKTFYPHYKTALLTNGTLFHCEDVINAALQFDLVAPSMDAVTERSFRLINRPASDISLVKMLQSLISFSHKYTGTLLLELFIIPGVNDSDEELAEFKNSITQMKITRVQLNSLDRPGTEKSVVTASPDRLKQIAHYLAPLPVEIISRNVLKTVQNSGPIEETEEKILSLIKRRPVTLHDLSILTALPLEQLSAVISTLEHKGEIKRTAVENNIFFQIRT
ncbi:MAG: radical SAM protein [Chitinispirillaceae bacterium]|nr:radical SAM protein [Chitinispirillaceae bacterium]